MLKDKEKFARLALNAALKLRNSTGQGLIEPVCIYDLVEKIGVEVRFVNFASMEGMYSKEPGPVILINADRPAGRQVFTCAHELGHHIFDHGTRIDKLGIEEQKTGPEEFMANCFAGYLLMPRIAVVQAFRKRGWNPANPEPSQAYVIANYFGVGYTTLINHLQFSLKMINSGSAKPLLKTKPKRIRLSFYGDSGNSNLIVADFHWRGRPIDIQVGDLILVPKCTNHEGNSLRHVKSFTDGELIEGQKPGLGRFLNTTNAWSAFVRVSRKAYEGRSIYRYLEEVVDE